MKRLFAFLSLVSVAGMASVADFDPFAPPEPPKVVRVQLEFVEVTHVDFTKLMAGKRDAADATALRMKLAEMVEQGRAEVVETMIVAGRSGKTATSESVREFIYPTEYEPPSLPTPGHFPLPPEDIQRSRLRIPPTPTAFETRNLGSTLEVAPKLHADGKTIDLHLTPEMVVPAGYGVCHEFTTLGCVRHQTKMPILVTDRFNTHPICRAGQYVLVTVLTPSDETGELDPSRKMLVMVKCDVLEVKEVGG